MPSLVGFGFHLPPGRPNTLSFFVCLFVCLFVTLLNVRDCAPDFAVKVLEYRDDFDTVGRFVVVHPRSTFSDCCQLATPLNAEGQKTAKTGFFVNRGRGINRSRRNLANKHIPWVCYRYQIWPSSVKGGRYRSHQNVKICPKLWFLATGSRRNEHIQMKFGMSV